MINMFPLTLLLILRSDLYMIQFQKFKKYVWGPIRQFTCVSSEVSYEDFPLRLSSYDGKPQFSYITRNMKQFGKYRDQVRKTYISTDLGFLYPQKRKVNEVIRWYPLVLDKYRRAVNSKEHASPRAQGHAYCQSLHENVYWKTFHGCCAAAAAAKLLQSCPTLCNPIDGSPPGSTIPGILQARVLEWVPISFSNA